jgi:hypothetical protein
MPGTTQSRWSSDDDEGVEVAPDGGDREGRARASPRGLEACTMIPITSARRASPVRGLRRRSRRTACGSELFVPSDRGEESGRRRGDWGTRCASRVDDTAGALFVSLAAPSSKEGGRREGTRIGSPIRVNAKREQKVPRIVPSPRTVHAAWRRRSRPSGSTRGRSRDRGPTPVDESSAGEARGATRYQRYADGKALGEEHAPARTLSSPKWASSA